MEANTRKAVTNAERQLMCLEFSKGATCHQIASQRKRAYGTVSREVYRAYSIAFQKLNRRKLKDLRDLTEDDIQECWEWMTKPRNQETIGKTYCTRKSPVAAFNGAANPPKRRSKKQPPAEKPPAREKPGLVRFAEWITNYRAEP